MKLFDVIAAISVKDDPELKPADLLCEIKAPSESAVRKTLLKALNDYSRDPHKSSQYEIVSVEEFDEGRILVDLNLLDLLGGCRVSLYFEPAETEGNDDFIRECVDEWTQEFFDANPIALEISSIEECANSL